MSPVFRHGRLRLYLLKLLDEAPRHGYEVIRLLQDRFMGVYSPSPGTIYPRLARLEEDGLVTHDEVDGRKVYRITEKGREEIRARLDDLAELEEELTESVRDIAREVTEDVRDTVRSLREEITWAARDVRREARPGASRPGASQPDTGRDDARRIRDEARQARDDIRDTFRSQRRGARGRQDWAAMPAGLERLASEFARELSSAAGHAGDIGDSALGDLRDILSDTLARIRDEIFADGSPAHREPGDDETAGDHAADPSASADDGSADREPTA
ncbi:MAG TPA: PadR family transcriptional regulator [Streptosporangiaceae bacterium]|nr:PadR family transcriptional regulator [Streptosporangiaceae bacterium]